MVDFSKKIINSNKFRQPAIQFMETGSYCLYPKGTSEYFSFWETETDRCVNGFTAEDGDYITGYNYFYLNYCPIQRIIYKITKDAKGHDVVKKTRETAFPDFYDYDYYYFLSIEEAENQGKHLCVAKARRKGFEQPESEEVLTPNGFVTMGSLKVGDFVINPDGRACKVIEINEQGEQEVYEVELQDGRKVRCGENHLWSTINSTRGKLHIKTTKEYSKLKLKQGSKGKEFYPYKLPSVRPIDFEQPPGKIDPYVLGVLLGDGYICGSQIKFSTDDIFIVEELSKRLPNYTIKPLTNKFQYVIISNQKGIHELGRELKTLGLRVKADKKFIPLEYKLAPIEYRMELLQGLMDTDGSCTNGASTFVSTSEQLVDDVAFLCRSLGIRCKKSNEIPGRSNVDFGNGNFSNTLPHWELTIITEENIFKLPRKLEKLRHDRTYKYNAIGLKSIKSLGYKEKQRCIIVDHDNSLYLTKDFIPTHNSYKGGAMLCRNFFLIPNSKSYVYAANKQYLTEDGILTKAWDYMDFIDGNTAWGKKRQVSNTAMRRRASMLVTDDYGNKVEIGYKSEIMGVSIKDNPDSVRGKAGKLILWEEAGSNNQLEAAWQIARPSVEQDGVAFGLMIMFGTGGDEGDNVAGLRNAFYDPKAFNCIEFDNIWDEGAQGGKPCGFFVPQHTNLDIRDENGKRLYMDEDGNTLHEKAREFILNLREEELKSAKSSQQVDRYCAEHSETPAEAFTELSGNIFPKKELQKQLARIRTNKKLANAKQVGYLTEVKGEIVWNISKNKNDIKEFPLPKTADPTGAIVIWEHPVKDAPFGLYIAGIDPYDQDQSGTNSLGSCIIYKRFQDFESYQDVIVAEYTGRPKTAEEFYENVRKLLKYYNAKAMVENQNTGIFTYFNNKHCNYLLADQPDIIRDITNSSKVNRGKGCHMTKEIKAWGIDRIKEWLEEDLGNDTLRLNTIMSEPLLEELIKYNEKINVDRVMALLQIMIYKEQLYNYQVKQKTEKEKQIRLFNAPLFKNYDNTYEPQINNSFSTTTYMFTN